MWFQKLFFNDFPSKKALESDNLDEEARIFYVGVTRAKEDLVFSVLDNKSLFVEQYFN